MIRVIKPDGTIMAKYQYDAWGNIISSSGSLAYVNPLRYRGYYYDAETGFYYLQSRYYDPSIGRFINTDGMASTGTGFLGYNMFAYCNSNPVNHNDPAGLRIVGFGIQFEGQVGDISYGIEIVIYTDPQVCGDKEYVVAIYNYSGYDISVGELQKWVDIAESLVSTAIFETHNDDVEAWYSAVTSVLNGVGASGGAFIIDGNDGFTSPENYAGGFETWSFSVDYKGASISGFHAFSDTCDAYGVKIGAHFDGIRDKKKYPFGISYSRSYYSDPYILGG